MPQRKIYRVAPAGAWWHVKHEGAVLSTHRLKQEAINAGRKIALDNQPSQLVLHRADGTIEQEWTYGSDPYPPQG